jgi:hypothetical protein
MMAEEKFSDNLLRAIYAQLHFQSGLLAAREMYGKSYFSLGVTEKMTLDQMVFGTIASNYQSITAEGLASHKSKEPIGFRIPSKPKT